MAEGDHANDALACAIDIKYLVYLVIVKGPDFTTTETETNGGEGKVLGDMAGIKVDISVGPLAILEFRALENSGPYKDGGGFCTHRLAEGRFGDVSAEVALL